MSDKVNLRKKERVLPDMAVYIQLVDFEFLRSSNCSGAKSPIICTAISLLVSHIVGLWLLEPLNLPGRINLRRGDERVIKSRTKDFHQVKQIDSFNQGNNLYARR